MREIDLPTQCGVFFLVSRGGQHKDIVHTGSQGSKQKLMADTGNGIDRERQNVRRQTIAKAGQRRDQVRTMRLIVHQQHRRLTAGGAINLNQGKHVFDQIFSPGQGVTHRTGGTHSAAITTSAAQRRVDFNIIAIGCDCQSGAIIEAIAASDYSTSGMGTEIGVITNVKRLFEFSHQIGRLE